MSFEDPLFKYLRFMGFLESNISRPHNTSGIFMFFTLIFSRDTQAHSVLLQSAVTSRSSSGLQVTHTLHIRTV